MGAVGFDGEDILVAAQTDNAFARPLSSYTNDYARYIKILGVRFNSTAGEDCFESVYNGIAIIGDGSQNALPDVTRENTDLKEPPAT